jgi:hypothetical protein
MWPRTAGETTALEGAHRSHYLKVEVEDGSGAFRNLCSLNGEDWVEDVTFGAHVDQPVMTASVHIKTQVGTSYLSPFVQSSSLNQIAAVYNPLLDVGREIRISTATTARGAAAPSSGDFKLLFTGEIDRVDPASRTLECRDLGGVLMDAQIETELVYGSDDGVDVEVVQQAILDDTLGGTVTLHTPVSPSFAITTYRQSVGGLLETLRTIALQNLGWDVRYRPDHDDASEWKLTLYEPDRANVTPDWTFGPSRYNGIGRLEIDREPVRNVVRVEYRAAGTGAAAYEQVEDAASIAKYGRRFMRLAFGDGSQIDTPEEATAVAEAALADLASPVADQEVTLPFFWPVEIGDLYAFTTNSRLYDTTQTLAVVGYRHTLSATSQTTTLQCRGTPAGAYRAWQDVVAQLAGSNAADRLETYLALNGFRETARTQSSVTYTATCGPGVSEVWEYQNEVTQPVTADPWPDGATTDFEVHSDRPTTFTYDVPPAGKVRYVQLEPRDSNLKSGPVRRIVIQPALVDPRLLSVTVSGQTISIVANQDTQSIKVAHTGGTWEYHVDGLSATILATATGTNAVAGIGATDVWPIEICAYAEPVVAVDGDTAYDCVDRTVSGSGASAEPTWTTCLAAGPAIVTDSDITLTLQASSAPALYTARVSERHRVTGGTWTAFADITANLSPSLTAPPTSSTAYTYTSAYERTTTSGASLVTYELRAEILNGSSAVVATQTAQASWYQGGDQV